MEVGLHSCRIEVVTVRLARPGPNQGEPGDLIRVQIREGMPIAQHMRDDKERQRRITSCLSAYVVEIPIRGRKMRHPPAIGTATFDLDFRLSPVRSRLESRLFSVRCASAGIALANLLWIRPNR
jgi:hypothetical protein